eukprot:11465825-Karenia_brevis.AAC.1
MTRGQRRRIRARKVAVLKAREATAELRSSYPELLGDKLKTQSEYSSEDVKVVLERLEGKMDSFAMVLQNMVDSCADFGLSFGGWPVAGPEKQIESVLEGLQVPGIPAEALERECNAVRRIQRWYRHLRIQRLTFKGVSAEEQEEAGKSERANSKASLSGDWRSLPTQHWMQIHGAFQFAAQTAQLCDRRCQFLNFS